MRFEQLKCLQEIAKTGSISGAAKNLFISQQAISNSIKQLEEELGVTLMMRSPRGVSLTAEGRDAVRFAQQILQEQDNFLQKVKYRQEHRSEIESLEVNICSTTSVINSVLSKILADLNMQMQTATMHVALENTSEEVMRYMQDHTNTIGLTTLNEPTLVQLCKDYGLRYEILARDEIVGVMDRRVSNFEKKFIENYDFESDRIALYNIEPIKEYRSRLTNYISISNDINFHKNLMTTINAIVLMPGISAKQFFSSSKYVILPLEYEAASLVHAAIYHPAIAQEYLTVVNMLRKEMIQL